MEELEEARRTAKRLFFWCCILNGLLIVMNALTAFLVGLTTEIVISILVIGILWAVTAQFLWRKWH